MEQTGFCCGQVPKRKKRSSDNNLPENPGITRGAELIYLGAGDLKIEGKASGLTYHVSDHRRRFKAEAGDVDVILKMPGFILKP
jgi:hypothetical protein